MKALRTIPVALSLLTMLAAGTAVGCAGAEDSSESSAAAVGSAPSKPLFIKMGEASALNEGATGVHSWIFVADVEPEGSAFVAQGVNMDGDVVAALRLDAKTGQFAAFESKSKTSGCTADAQSGNGCTGVTPEMAKLYVAEFQHVVQEIDAAVRATAEADPNATNSGTMSLAISTTTLRPADFSDRAGRLALCGGVVTLAVSIMGLAVEAAAAIVASPVALGVAAVAAVGYVATQVEFGNGHIISLPKTWDAPMGARLVGFGVLYCANVIAHGGER